MKDPQDDLALGAWFEELFERDAQRADTPAQPTETIAYGTHPDQHVDGWSVVVGEPVVLSIHGGYFMTEYDASLHVPMVRQLVADGFGAANVEYRRGESGRAATIADVWAALDAVVERWHPSSVAVVGHSAGGYLAEKLASHPAVDLVMPLAPVSDLAEASREGWDDGGVAQWMGADPHGCARRVSSGGSSRRNRWRSEAGRAARDLRHCGRR